MPYVTIVVAGSYVEVLDGLPKRCARGSIVLHSPGEEHADHFTLGTRCLNVELPNVSRSAVTGTIVADAALKTATRLLARSYFEGNRSSAAASVATFAQLLSRPPIARRQRPSWLAFALASFEWTGATPLQFAARSAGVHPMHFSREFRRHMGMTPSAYRRHCRIERASHMLTGSGYSLARIAMECGFADQSHFTRTFATSLALSPGQYRRIFER